MDIEDNVIYLKHIGELSQSDLDDIRNSLQPAAFELKALNGNGKVTASMGRLQLYNIYSLKLSFPDRASKRHWHQCSMGCCQTCSCFGKKKDYW
jgi:hypothetical protein